MNDPYNQGSESFETWHNSLRISLNTGDVGIGTPPSRPENPFPQGSKHYEEWEQGFFDAVDYTIRGEYIKDDDQEE